MVFLIILTYVLGYIYCYGYICITGADRFSKDISMMTGREVTVFLRVLWVLVIPVVMVVSICYGHILFFQGYSKFAKVFTPIKEKLLN